ncbi:hypothetical protein AbraIFM66950_012229 [Aspergillus brasiliensis]|nr:hypothetical protein AbraIFM66950_012229 [Aspergillus brasiliensis]
MPFFSVGKHFNRTLALSCALVALSQLSYGFDNQGFATTQSMTAFEKQFGEYDTKTGSYAIPTYFLSLLNSLNYIGFAVGLVVGSLISNRYGRRVCMISMNCWALVTATIIVTSQTRGQILAARILNYAFVGMELAVVPVYQAEIVPAPVRGFAVGTYQLSVTVGGLIIHVICRATSTLPGNASWRIPLGLYYIIPSVVLCLIWWIPESPRWLLTKDRPDEAAAAMKRLRSGRFSDEEIAAELSDLQTALATEVEHGTFTELFQGVNLKRTFIVIGLNFFQQATGQAFASQYGAIFIKSLNTINTYDVTLMNSAIATVICLLSNLFSDRAGRRPLLLLSAGIQAVALFVMAGLGEASSSASGSSLKHISAAIVAMLSLFGVGFATGWGPLTYVVSAEVPALRLRDQSQRVAMLTNIAMNFIVTFTLPYLLDDGYAALHAKVGFIFGSLAVVAAVFTYFYVPDCRGKSLEEVDRFFHEGVPVRHFSQMTKVDELEHL